MATGQRPSRCSRYHVVGLTWILLVFSYLHICHSLTIDEIISRAMKNTLKGCTGIYDEKQRTIRVGLDMIFPVEDWAKLLEVNSTGRRHTVTKRQAIAEGAGGRYWPGGIVYYHIKRFDFSRWDIRVLQAAMEEWMRHTCVQFRRASFHNHNRIVFGDGDGCASDVGMSRNPQPVVLSRGCRTKGVVIHELGHVLGFNHEQTRPDRDYYVRIRWENIPGNMRYNFNKYSWSVVRNLGVPYDYLSIMHYGKDSFTGNGRETIETRDPKYQDLIGNRRGLSFRDIKSTNILYNCKPPSDRCSLQDEDCPGEGFVSKDCTCWCPTPDIYTHPDSPYYICTPDSKKESGSHSTSNRGGATIDRESQRKSSSECEDQDTDCQMWAQRGECQNNPDYMTISCRKACGLCDTEEEEEAPCHDAYSRCAFWKEKGYCGRSSAFSIFITANCRQTCGLCKTGPDPEGGKTWSCQRQCWDDNELCQTWAARGECTATPDYMLRHCRRACNACCTHLGDHTSPTPKRPDTEGRKTRSCQRQCWDDNELCQTWAARGECTATPDYMLRHCRRACNACCTHLGDHTSNL